MSYALIIDGAVVEHPYTLAKLKKDNPNVSFPAAIPDDVLAAFNVFPVAEQDKPSAADDEAIEEAAPEKVDGVWKRKYLKRTLTPEEFDARRQAKAKDMRDKRDRLLADTDWTQLLDAPTATQTTYAAYRQLVRDVTKQAGFPFGVDWPAKP